MTARADRLLREIESGALDHRTSIGDLLRKAVALGGRAGSTELRDWATRELRGYGPDDELPEYRKIAAPLQLDMINAAFHVRGHSISPLDLPEVAHGVIENDLNLRMGIGEIEQLARRNDAVKLQPPGAAELVRLMNARPRWNANIQELYWSVSTVALVGVVDKVRTTLTVMVAEMLANLPDGSGTPPAEVATNAVNFAVTGTRNKISFAAPQGGSSVTTASPEQDEQGPRQWLRLAGAVLLGLVAIAGLIFALMQVQGWHFG